MRFTAPLHHVDVDRLRTAFRTLKKDAAPAVDGVTWQQCAGGGPNREARVVPTATERIYPLDTAISRPVHSASNNLEGGATMRNGFVRVSCGLYCLLIGGAFGCGESPSVESTRSNLFGSVNQVDPHPFAAAIGRISLSNGSSCTASLVGADRVLTAAHCFCAENGKNPTSGTFQLADNTGNLAGPTWSFTNWQVDPNAFVCSDLWNGPFVSDSNETYAGSDLTVITLTPNSSGAALPPVTPITVSLDDPNISFHGPDVRLEGKFWAVGYGSNAPGEFISPDQCVGCSVRRSGQLNALSLQHVDCNSVADVKINVDFFDCWNGVMFTAPSFGNEGETVEPSFGDSGGPIMFNVDNTSASPPPVVLGAIMSNFDSANTPDYAHWATTGQDASFLWSALGLPFTLTLAQQQQGTAVYTKGFIDVHDRGHVVSSNGTAGALMVSNGGSEVLIEGGALVGDIKANTEVLLRDRATTGAINTSSTVLFGNSDVTGTVHQGVFQKFEDFSIALPFPVTFANPVPQLLVNPNTTRNLQPSVWGDVVVYGGATLNLSDGLYIFHSIDLESNSKLVVQGTRTWVFVATGSNPIIRGAVVAPAGGLLMALPSATWFKVGDNFTGTIVAPNSEVDVDMVANAVYTGSVFAQGFQLFEGEFLKFVPFSGNWIPHCGGTGFTSCM